jgi:TRAP-type mannitol/chloroaromatic compound transport system permease small subunit
MCIFLFWEVFVRYFLNSPTSWAFELCQMLFVACSILNGGYILQTKNHIKVDILSSKFSSKINKLISILVFPLFCLFVGSMAYFGYEFALESIKKLEYSNSAWGPPVYPIKVLIPLGAILLLLQGISNLVEELRGNPEDHQIEMKEESKYES